MVKGGPRSYIYWLKEALVVIFVIYFGLGPKQARSTTVWVVTDHETGGKRSRKNWHPVVTTSYFHLGCTHYSGKVKVVQH